MKAYLTEQLAEPSDDFVKHMASQVFSGRLTEIAREKFKVITKKAFTQFVSDKVSDRLASALSEEKAANTPEQENNPVEIEQKPESKIVTTQDEIDGYNIVRAILRSKVDVKRLTIKDTIDYCNVILDGSRRKPVCRFYFNNPNNKSLAIFDEAGKQVKIPIEALDDIYLHADKLIATLEAYLTKNTTISEQAE